MPKVYVRPLYTEEEDIIIADAWQAGTSDKNIALLMMERGYCRTDRSIKARRVLLGLISPTNRSRQLNRAADRLDAEYKQDNRTAREKLVMADRAFKVALMGAIRSGDEHSIIGVVKDRRPWALKTIHAEPVGSGCGSSAAACAEG